MGYYATHPCALRNGEKMRETSCSGLWCMVVAMGIGVAGCGDADTKKDEPNGLVDTVEEEPKKDESEKPTQDPDNNDMMVDDVVEMPVEEPPLVESPEVRCSSTLLDEEPYPSDLPGFDRFEFTVVIDDHTKSFIVVGYSERNNGALLESFTTPSGEGVDVLLSPTFSRFASMAFYTSEASVMPLVLPPAPGYEDLVQGGTYTFHGLSKDAEFCYYVVESHAPGRVLNLNLFFVDVEGVDGTTAAQNPDVQEMVEIIVNTFAAGGIEVHPNFVPIPPEVASRHADVRSFSNLDDAVKEIVASVDPLPMRSVDVFLWDVFEGEAARMHGMARGIPEATGLHGERGSGVVLQTMELLGFEGIFGGRDVVGNIELGLSISHEIGHLLGLFHTSEFHDATMHDFATDTPECSNAYQLQHECPDANNLMFPLGPIYASSHLSEEQVATLQAHPSLEP